MIEINRIPPREQRQPQQLYDYPPPGYSQKNTTNSFSRRPSSAQIIAYTIIITQIIAYFLCIYPIYSSIQILSIYCFLTALTFVSGFMCSFIDPTDRKIYEHKWKQYKKLQNPQHKIDYELSTQISYCGTCESYCSVNSKHCRQCNRCVILFDHHCMWINNCIGVFNYNWFFLMIISLFSQMVIFQIHGFLSIFLSFQHYTQALAQKIIVWIEIGIIGFLAFLLLNLIIMHLYLICTNQTTYGLFLKQRKMRQQNKIHNIAIQNEIPQGGPLENTAIKINVKATLVAPTEPVLDQNYTSINTSNLQAKQTKKQIKSQKDEKQQKIPYFFRNNRSLKLILGNNFGIDNLQSN